MLCHVPNWAHEYELPVHNNGVISLDLDPRKRDRATLGYRHVARHYTEVQSTQLLSVCYSHRNALLMQ